MKNIKIMVFGLLVGLMSGSCAFSAETPNSVIIVNHRHLSPQPWNSSRMCLAEDQNGEQVCIELSSEIQGDNKTFTPDYLGGVAVYYSENKVLSLTKQDLDKIHSPIHHSVKIKPSWKRLSFNETVDFLELEIPYGFIENREICFSENSEEPSFLDSTSTLYIKVFFNGAYEIDTDGPNCLESSK